MRARGLMAALGGAVGLLCAAGPAVAVEGNLYPSGPGASGADPQFYEARSGSNITVNAPELRPAYAGTKWAMRWDGCAVAGSEIARVEWTGARSAAPSSLEVQVAANGGVAWRIADVTLPLVSQGAHRYAVELGGGACEAQLRLHQTERRDQHARGYVVNEPRILVRDVAPPSVTLGPLPGGWIGGGAGSVRVSWTAADNFGADGMGAQRLSVGGEERWVGTPGAGDHVLTVGLDGLPDGAHPVVLRVDGDGTGAAEAAGVVRVDRTAPSVVSTGTSPTERPGVVSLNWSSRDELSGVGATSVEVNTATDGSGAGAWREVAGSASESGGGQYDLRALGEGVHAWRVRATDRAGNGGVTPGAGKVVVDLTPPALQVGLPSDAWGRRVALVLEQSDNLQSALGLGRTEFGVNSAPDGTSGGSWIALTPAALGPGRHTPAFDLSTLPTGRHLLRVLLRNGGPLGQALVTERTVEVRVDNTPPAVSDLVLAPVGDGRVRATWQAEDRHSGLAVATVQGWTGTAWRPLGSTPDAGGAGGLTVDPSSLPPGDRRLRVVVVDAAGNDGDALADLRPAGAGPAISDLRLDGGPPWILTWVQSDPDGFGACPTVVEIAGAGSDDEWRQLLSGRRGAGTQRVEIPVGALPAGGLRMRVTACDATGATTSATIGGSHVGRPAPLAAAQPSGDVTGARLFVSFRGVARALRRGRDEIEVQTIRHGATVLVTGQLLDAGDLGVTDVPLEVRGPRGRVLWRGRTGPNGYVRISMQPDVGGALRFAVPTAARLVPLATPVALEVNVRPLLTLETSARAVDPGGRVVFTGRVAPAPRRIGVARKSIVLEWRDPIRHAWRPVVIAPLRRDGAFRVPWRFNLRGFTIPMRMRLLGEAGWPLLPATSRVVPITVRS